MKRSHPKQSTQIKRPVMQDHPRMSVRLALFFTALAGYAAFFLTYRPPARDPLLTLVVIPIFLAGAFFGLLPGLITALGMLALNLAGFIWLQGLPPSSLTPDLVVPILLSALFVGGSAGYLADVQRRARRDLEERKRVERLMRESEEKLASILVAINDGVISYALPGVELLNINPAVERLYGLTLNDLLRDPTLIAKSVFHEDQAAYESLLAELLERNNAERTYRIVRPDGDIRWVLDRGQVVLDAGGNPMRVVRLVSDVTTRKQAEETLLRAKSELEARVLERTTELRTTNVKLQYELAERMKAEKLAQRRAAEAEQGNQILAAIMEFIPEGIAIAAAPDVSIRMMSKQGMEMMGSQVNTIQGLPLAEQPTPWRIYHLDGVTPAAVDELPLTRSVLTGEMIKNEEWILVQEDGTPLSILCNAGPIRDRHDEIVGGILAWRDITDRKKTLKEVSQQAEQIEAHHYLLKGREMERLATARNLHDGLLQNLITISFAFNEAYRVAKDDPTRKILIAIRSSLQDQINNLRNYCGELRPPILVHFGVEKAIRSHLERFQAEHPDITVQTNLVYDAQKLPEDTRLTLFRIYNELMSNVARHARASSIFIRYALDNGCAEIEVADNGTGFEVPASWIEFVREGRLGLVGIRERVEAIDGSFSIISAAGKGTRVRVSIPVKML